jgi:hypothetical protein
VPHGVIEKSEEQQYGIKPFQMEIFSKIEITFDQATKF